MQPRLGFTHVVAAMEKRPAGNAAVELLHVPAHDSVTSAIFPFFPDVVRFIHGARVGGRKVYVHCARGVSRSRAFFVWRF